MSEPEPRLVEAELLLEHRGFLRALLSRLVQAEDATVRMPDVPIIPPDQEG